MLQYIYLLGKSLAILHLVIGIIVLLLLLKVPGALKSTTFWQIILAVTTLAFLSFLLFFMLGKVLELIKRCFKKNYFTDPFSKKLKEAKLIQNKEKSEGSLDI